MLDRFGDKCDRLSAKEVRPNKDLERRSDSIGTRKALDAYDQLKPYSGVKAFPGQVCAVGGKEMRKIEHVKRRPDSK